MLKLVRILRHTPVWRFSALIIKPQCSSECLPPQMKTCSVLWKAHYCVSLSASIFWNVLICRKGLYPVFVWEPPDAAGELHHPSPQADGEPAASAGECGQDALLHGPRHQLLPRGQRHRQDHQRGVRLRWRWGVCCGNGYLCQSVWWFVSGRRADWMSILLV